MPGAAKITTSRPVPLLIVNMVVDNQSEVGLQSPQLYCQYNGAMFTMPIEGRTRQIEESILNCVEIDSANVSRETAKRFGITRQAVSRHLRKLVNDGVITPSGATRSRRYELVTLVEKDYVFHDASHLQEDVIWRENVAPLLTGLAENVVAICRYGFTEMVNNVIEHSESTDMSVRVEIDALRVNLRVHDQGVGIFDKIQKALGLADPREAVIELSKGKFTTDQQKHTGEGIFFSSQAFDIFSILSAGLFYTREDENDDWFLEEKAEGENKAPGTLILMKIRKDSTRTLQAVFDRFSDPRTFAFNRTHIPLALARYEGDELVSRSQARRLLQRLERFKEIMLDFKGVESIGQPFADEIFRVFKSEHPEMLIVALNTTPQIDQMISRAQAAGLELSQPQLSLALSNVFVVQRLG